MKLLSYLVILIHFFTISKCRNTLLIVADDYGLEAGCLGNSVIRTPNIDKLAQKSVIYRQDSQFCTLFFEVRKPTQFFKTKFFSQSQNVETHYLSLRTIMVWKQDVLAIQLSEHQVLTNQHKKVLSTGRTANFV